MDAMNSNSSPSHGTAAAPGTGQARGPMRIVFFNRRDTSNPEGGGSELYVESIARTLASHGHHVIVYSAAHEEAPKDELINGVNYVRRGGKLSVLPRAWFDLVTRRLGAIDVVVDVQNGVPFFSPLATRRPVIALVHHVHREMWPVVYGERAARFGWWVESRAAPWLYRRSRYVAVSAATEDELVELGVARERITVIHNGVDAPLPTSTRPTSSPSIVILGRLVPHKQITDAFIAVRDLQGQFPDLSLRVVGDGWWSDQLRIDASSLGVDDKVTFTGFVSPEQKADELAQAWLLAIPSLKEGWGLVVLEAASYGVPSVGYAHARGVGESIVSGETGWVVDGGPTELTAAIRSLLADPPLRRRMGEAARVRARSFSWARTGQRFEDLLAHVLGYFPCEGRDGTSPANMGTAPVTPVVLRGPSDHT